jgi:hypothetical protein
VLLRRTDNANRSQKAGEDAGTLIELTLIAAQGEEQSMIVEVVMQPD